MQSHKMRKVLAEIHRRGLFSTAALYLAGAWIAIQVGTTLAPILGFPDWTPQALVVVLASGFPLALLCAWFYDIRRASIANTSDDPVPPATAPAEPPPARSIAVLPFLNLSNDTEREYFSDGIAEELLNSLAAVPQIKVAARTSSFAFKGKESDIRVIARQLGVRNVLEGSVRWAGSRVRITAQLIDAAQGYHLWTQTFDREIEDIFAIQSEIASAIAAALRLRLDESPGPVAATSSMNAYHAYLRARFLWQHRGEAAIRAAIEEYKQALTFDPLFARAYASLAAAYAVLPEHSGESRQRAFARARSLAHKGLELDPALGEAHGVLSYIHLWLWEWEEAEQSLQRALTLEPNNPQLHQWYANILNDLARPDDALTEARKAYELDPISPTVNCVLALCHATRGEDEAAMYHAAIARELGAGPLPLGYVEFLAHLRKAEYAAARMSAEQAMSALGKDVAWIPPAIAALEDRTRADDALRALEHAHATGTIPFDMLFLFYVLLGLADAVYAIAHGKLADRSLTHLWLLLPEAAALRDDPRFIELMRRMGLAGYWERHGLPQQLAGHTLAPPAPTGVSAA
jgi:TolB-like protein/Tfp pilus assembly protein PilF